MHSSTDEKIGQLIALKYGESPKIQVIAG